jgi:hypothetical protein
MSIKHRKVSLSPDPGVVIHEAMRVLHRPPAPLIPVLADPDAERAFEGERGVAVVAIGRSGGSDDGSERRGGGVTVEDL